MPNYYSGKTGNVNVDGTPVAFGKWKLSSKTKLVPVNNFLSQGFNQNVPGFRGATVTCTGPVNDADPSLEDGTEYEFTLDFDTGVGLVVNCLVETVEYDDDADGNPIVNITAQSQGVYSVVVS